MFSPGKFQIRSWMVIYVGLIATMVLAGRPVGSQSSDIETMPGPAMVVESPLLRRDI